MSKLFQEVQIVNKEYYLSIMQHLGEQIHRKTQVYGKKTVDHDNAPSQNTRHKIIMNAFQTKNSTNTIEPPYSPDIY